MVAQAGSGWLVTTSADGLPIATLLPLVWHGSTVIAHMAKPNPHWNQITTGGPCLVIVGGPEAYVSPSWYPSKAEHQRVVPTWNYLAVHLTGTVKVHRDPEWLLGAVSQLTDMHEGERQTPWQVTDAPPDFIDNQLKGIVGIEVLIDKVEAKAKLSQNRPENDQLSVMRNLRSESSPSSQAIAAAMSEAWAEAADDSPSADNNLEAP